MSYSEWSYVLNLLTEKLPLKGIFYKLEGKEGALSLGGKNGLNTRAELLALRILQVIQQSTMTLLLLTFRR